MANDGIRDNNPGRGAVVVAELRKAYLSGKLTAVVDGILADQMGGRLVVHSDAELIEMVHRAPVRPRAVRDLAERPLHRRKGQQGVGSNLVDRLCLDCPAVLPATNKRGRPKLRCDECARLFRNAEARAKTRSKI